MRRDKSRIARKFACGKFCRRMTKLIFERTKPCTEYLAEGDMKSSSGEDGKQDDRSEAEAEEFHRNVHN